ncbi:hypothetical protein PSACC_00082 [Paramicrosporidium saccamoebae]|uniref:Pre-rRNA-processing protein Ipi1 N-terminal domain-containing protein n=1 Tax=Paramicrosporidium saccamoebae TaxID=1246581 RepID=A0A2H9TQS8_9FUNG|nr:hypothetical protein PSACC_00082 [Paramicrosporidium saccamoebae]
MYQFGKCIPGMANLNKKSRKTGPKDFEKSKVKVGRAKAGAVNATNTSFQTKRLALREQHLSTAQKIEATSEGSSSALAAILKPTLSQTGHYNTNVRKEAFATLLKRCKEHPDIGDVINVLLEHASRGMVDNEAVVRTAVLHLTVYLWEQKVELRALFGGWVQFALLAMTHLHTDIRRDSIKFLEAALKAVPMTVLLPYTGNLLAALADGTLSRQKGNKAQECAMQLVAAYTKAKMAPESAPPLHYCWQSVQSNSLIGARLRKTTSDQILEGICEMKFSKIIAWLSNSLLDDWLEASPITGSVQRGAKSSERQAHTRVAAALKGLLAFSIASGYDSDTFVNLLPAPIRTSPHIYVFIK